MTFSIITATYNSASTIEQCLDSIVNQTYKDVEVIVVDGCSSDSTLAVIKKKYGNIPQIVSEPDKGIYDAMNKGIYRSKGDIVGILNSDDEYFSNDVLKVVKECFANNPDIDMVFADIVYADKNNRLIRYYSGKGFAPYQFKFGMMPPHPSVFIRRCYYQKYGIFNTGFRIAADFDLLLRFILQQRINYKYIPKTFVKMRVGGISTKGMSSNMLLNKEILESCKKNKVKTNYFFIYLKYLIKIFQFIPKSLK